MSEGALDLLVMRSCSTFKNLCAVLYDVQNLLTFARNRRSPFEPHLRQTLTQYKQITSFGKCLGGNCLLRPGRTGKAPRPQHRRQAMSECGLSNHHRLFVLRTHAGRTPAFQSLRSSRFFDTILVILYGDLLSASKRRRRCQKSLP